MSSFVFDIGERQRKVGRFIAHVRSELQNAFISEKKQRKLTQQAVADRMGVNRSVIHRQLMGEENLTLRSVVELSLAIGWEPHFELRKPSLQAGSNAGTMGAPALSIQTSTVAPKALASGPAVKTESASRAA